MKKTLCALLLASTFAASAFADQPVTINFAGEIGGKPFACGETYSGLGATGASIKGTDYRLFISGASLVRADGSLQPIKLEQDGKWQLDDLALLDFEDASSGCKAGGNPDLNKSLRGSVPDGEYKGLAFTVGVPFEKNHIDPTISAAPLNTTSMFWNWQNGFRFVRIDMVPTDRAENGPKGWFLHLGSTQCAGKSKTEAPSACVNSNRIAVSFDTFDPKTNVVVIDPAPVIAGADLRANAPETSPGCMSFPGDADCKTVMARLGQAYGEIPADKQLLVTAR